MALGVTSSIGVRANDGLKTAADDGGGSSEAAVCEAVSRSRSHGCRKKSSHEMRERWSYCSSAPSR